jgi:hypothetical protein
VVNNHKILLLSLLLVLVLFYIRDDIGRGLTTPTDFYHPSTIIRADTIFCSSKEELEDTKGAIRNRISKNRQHNGQNKKHKRTNNDRENIHD